MQVWSLLPCSSGRMTWGNHGDHSLVGGLVLETWLSAFQTVVVSPSEDGFLRVYLWLQHLNPLCCCPYLATAAAPGWGSSSSVGLWGVEKQAVQEQRRHKPQLAHLWISAPVDSFLVRLFWGSSPEKHIQYLKGWPGHNYWYVGF